MGVNSTDTCGRRTAGLFFCDCVRLLLLVILLFIAPRGGFINGILPVYISSNALFPLMALFMWLKPEEYRNYITLYTAGKVITLVSFFAWEIFSSGNFTEEGNPARNILLLGMCIFLNLADIFSVWIAGTVQHKWRQRQCPPPEPAVHAGKGDI